MIYDTLDHASQYTLDRRFDLAFEYLRSGRPATDATGTYKLDGDDVFAMVQEYTTKPESDGFWEAHFIYADVQYLVTGRERMGVAPLATMKLKEDRSPAQDLAVYDGDGAFLNLEAGQFTVFFPQDAHMPGIADGDPVAVRKVVVKVRVDA